MVIPVEVIVVVGYVSDKVEDLFPFTLNTNNFTFLIFLRFVVSFIVIIELVPMMIISKFFNYTFII